MRELLRARRRRIRRLVVSTDLDADPLVDEIVVLAGEAHVRIEYVSGAELDELARTSAPQGVVAQAMPVADADVDTLLAHPEAFIVALDGVTDPGNLGAVIRTAETAGATGVVLPRHRAAGLSPAAVKAASGAIEYLPIALVAGIPAFLDRGDVVPDSGPSASTSGGRCRSSSSRSGKDRWSSCSVPRAMACRAWRATGARSSLRYRWSARSNL